MNGDRSLPTTPQELLTPARAAAIAERSVRTIRRAYSSGRLVAFRDGGGRGVRISYGDLCRWMMSEEISSSATPGPTLQAPNGLAPQSGNAGRGDNLALIRAAREHRRRAPHRA